MKKIAIIGASYFQEPLIQKAKSMGIETHVFAWAVGDAGEKSADTFYPISIVEKEEILETCKKIGIDGICTIASDLAAITVNYVAEKMGLVGNSLECTYVSTNKRAMRERFEKNRDPSPKSVLVTAADDLKRKQLTYPVIVKPIDRSGSRGITKVTDASSLAAAIEEAKRCGFQKAALVEEFVTGQEYSVECISWRGEHHFLALTQKYTTGAPHFIETGHLEPASVDKDTLQEVKEVTFHALDSLGIQNGASHTELKISESGRVSLIEVGGRMGGDFIGSSLVKWSTGVDFVRAVLQVALGEAPDIRPTHEPMAAAVRFVVSEQDMAVLAALKRERPEYLICEDVHRADTGPVADSSTRHGYYLMSARTAEELKPYLP